MPERPNLLFIRPDLLETVSLSQVEIAAFRVGAKAPTPKNHRNAIQEKPAPKDRLCRMAFLGLD